jgi:hypothetical protein
VSGVDTEAAKRDDVAVDDGDGGLSVAAAPPSAPEHHRRRMPRFSEGDLVAITVVLVGSIAGLGLLVILIFSLFG